MLPNPVDVYYNSYATQLFDETSGAARVFSFLELLYAEKTPAPWGHWFEQQSEELNNVIKNLQTSSSYPVYAEHLFAGMPYWNLENLTNPRHIESLHAMHREVNETTWHALGQRDNGLALNKIVDAVTEFTGRDFMQDAMRSSPHATAIGFYNGFLDVHTHPLENGDYSPDLYAWISRLCQENLPLTRNFFCDQYSSIGFLWAVHALQQSEKTQTAFNTDSDIRSWITEQPAQSEALYAYLTHEMHSWRKPSTPFYDSALEATIWENTQLIASIYSDIPSVEQYVRLYTTLFNQTPLQRDTSLELPFNFDT